MIFFSSSWEKGSSSQHHVQVFQLFEGFHSSEVELLCFPQSLLGSRGIYFLDIYFICARPPYFQRLRVDAKQAEQCSLRKDPDCSPQTSSLGMHHFLESILLYHSARYKYGGFFSDFDI